MAPPAPGAFRIHNIDLGTGLGVLVQGNDFTMLFDGGSNDDAKQMSSTSNGNRLLAYLAAALGPSGPASCTPDGDKWTKTDRPRIPINHVFLSHPHDDHVSMLADVLTCYDVANVWDAGDPYASQAYAKFLDTIGSAAVGAYHTAAAVPGSDAVTVEGKNISIPASTAWTQFSENDMVSLGAGATLKILHADGGLYPNDANLNSTVVRLDLGATSVLLTGDEEAGSREDPSSAPGKIEAQLLASHAADLRVNIFQVAHHGSMTSSRTAFLSAVSPAWALIGSGPTPYSGVVLPDASVIQAIQALGPTLFNTNAHDASGCPVSDRIGLDDTAPGGCDNYILDIGAGSSDVQGSEAGPAESDAQPDAATGPSADAESSDGDDEAGDN
jgi:competence protein ComEC